MLQRANSSFMLGRAAQNVMQQSYCNAKPIILLNTLLIRLTLSITWQLDEQSIRDTVTGDVKNTSKISHHEYLISPPGTVWLSCCRPALPWWG